MHPYILSTAVDCDEPQHEKISVVHPVFTAVRPATSKIKEVNVRRRGKRYSEGMYQPLQHPSDMVIKLNVQIHLVPFSLVVEEDSLGIPMMLIEQTLVGIDQSQSLMKEEDPWL